MCKIFSTFFILIILNNFYNQNPKLFLKIIVQVLVVLIAADIVWIIVISTTWKHSSTDRNDYWSSLSTIHTIVIILAYLELILKALTVAYLIYDYNQKNPQELRELFKFTYLEQLSSQSNCLLIFKENLLLQMKRRLLII